MVYGKKTKVLSKPSGLKYIGLNIKYIYLMPNQSSPGGSQANDDGEEKNLGASFWRNRISLSL